MKNFKLFLLIMGGLFTITVFSSNSGGRTAAGSPRTGAPSTGGGIEGTCSQCHSSGSSTFGEPVVSWTIADGDGNNISEYVPGQVYNVTVAVSAPMGSPSAYGFNAVFLDDTEAPNGASAQVAGTFSNLSSFAQITVNGGREYLEHNDRTPSGVWTFDWTAPAAGFGEVRIYSTGNAVNSNFNTGGDSGSTSSTVVTLQESVTMPVTLAYFEASAEKNDVTLNWETVTEENASHFEVERSRDGISFTAITEITAKALSGAAEYAYIDADLPSENFLYRLKMVDLDGSFEYSPAVAITVESNQLISVFPNPASGQFTLSLSAGTTARTRLLNANGAVIRDNLLPGQQDISDIQPGLYLVETIVGKSREVSRLVVR